MQTMLPLSVSILLVAAAVLLVILAQRRQYHEQIMDRLSVYEAHETETKRRRYRTDLWKLLLRRAGLNPQPLTGLMIVFGLVFFSLIGFIVMGIAGLVVALVAGVAGVLVLGYIAVKRHNNQLLRELPSFLDQIIRSLKTGNSLAGAFREGAAELSGNLAPAMRQVVRFMDLGYDVGEALTEVARIHRLREFSIMALAVRVNTYYGGSAIEILQNLIDMIHQRERIRRQLRALTSETRFSAIVLGAMPILIGGYMIAVNPDYIMTLWQHDNGQWIVVGALSWQVLGMILLWRMVRSLG